MKLTSGGGELPSVVLAAILANHAVAAGLVAADMGNTFFTVEMELFQRDTVKGQWDSVATVSTGGYGGSGVTDGLSHGVACVGRLIVAEARRQGRTFLPGFLESTTANSLLGAGPLANFLLYMIQFAADVVAGASTLQWCVYNTDILSTLYQTESLRTGAVLANDLVGYQRRRKPGVGL